MHECNNHKQVKQYKAQQSGVQEKAPMVSSKVIPAKQVLKVPKVIDPSLDNIGLSNCSLSNIILKRISLECDIAYQPNQTFGPKWSPHHILSKAKRG